ncbi:hypothetical protein PG993_001354 [Apiospora rasikravindrae]|uniref:PrsW family intramembrane metalloprotease n=1 Tax=Apiospora rasikravindrae TaxID=990691 RepID=A0ABR1UB50_9PEZI
MSTSLGLLGHRLINFPSALTASCTSLALGSTMATQSPSPSSAPRQAAAAHDQHQHRGRPFSIAGTMLFAGTFGLTAMSLFQLLSMRAFLALLFGGRPGRAGDYIREFLRSAGGRAHLEATLSAAEVADRAAMARDWRYGVLCALFGVVSAGLPEEVLKYLPAAAVQWWRGRKAAAPAGEVMSPLEFVNYTVAAGIGFAIFENVGVVYGSVSGGNSTAEIALLLAERTLSALPGHVLCAALSGIRGASSSARRRRSGKGGGMATELVDMLSAILPSVLYHGVFDAALLGVSALCGHPGWVRPADPWVLAGAYGMVVALQGSLALNVRAVWRQETQALEGTGRSDSSKKEA